MPVQHSPPAKNTKSQRNTSVFTLTERVPLDHTPSVHQLSANLDRGPTMEGAAPSRQGGMKSRRSRSFSGLLDTTYHERQKEKGSHQEKKPPVTGSNSSRPPKDSCSKRSHHKKNKKGKEFQASKDKAHSALLNNDNNVIGSKKERRIKEGLCTYCGEKQPIEKCFKRPQNKPWASRGFPSKKGKS
ncbi:hypothetical protein O181_125486 [Austropuccinia psidii MF-1]|uniref:Uncharacterized protein n=1 Tax=Austropuccinia psidii MF-1 TaxID=1389203 RepID=A0A9Q3Q530_9BASI|nr:hypothetical protein [Austropuccinia psidii MF-1]